MLYTPNAGTGFAVIADNQQNASAAQLTNGSMATIYWGRAFSVDGSNTVFSDHGDIWLDFNGNAPVEVSTVGNDPSAQTQLSGPPQVVALTGGGFEVLWEQTAGDAQNHHYLMGRAYDASGNPLNTPQILVTDTLDPSASFKAVASSDGGFAVLYDARVASANWDVTFFKFDSTGALTDTVPVNHTSAVERVADLAQAPDGVFIATYNDAGVGETVIQRIANVMTVAQAIAAYNANNSITGITISDASANVVGGLNSLQTLTAHGAIGSISFTDAPSQVAVSAAQLAADAATLALISGSFDLSVAAGGASVNYTLANNIANLIISGESSANIIGNSSFHAITLGSGNDTASTGSHSTGTDAIDGGAGNDVLYGGAANDFALWRHRQRQPLWRRRQQPVRGRHGQRPDDRGHRQRSHVWRRRLQLHVWRGRQRRADRRQGLQRARRRAPATTTYTSITLAGAYGGDGNDVLVGNLNNDMLIGDAGDDVEYGYGGNDYLYGGDGNDVFYGGDGVDVLIGGAGNDYFDGGTGVNYYFGGSGGGPGTGQGNDTFVLTDTGATQSIDVVQDWTEGADHVNLIGSGFSSFNDVLANSYQNGAYFVVQPDANNAIWLNGATAATLTAADFSIVS